MAVFLRHFVIFARLSISHSILTTSVACKTTLHFYVINVLHFLPCWVDIRRIPPPAAIASSVPGLFVFETSRSHTGIPQWVGLLCTSDQPEAEISIWRHATVPRDRLPCPCGIRNRNPNNRAAADPGHRPAIRGVACTICGEAWEERQLFLMWQYS